MGRPSGPAMYRVVAVLSAIFAIGVIAVAGTLLNQAIKYKEYYFYGGGAGYGGSDYYGYGAGRSFFSQGSYGYGGAYQDDLGYDPYRYHRVIAIAAVALGAGLIQFMLSFMLCCVNGENSKPLAIGYLIGFGFILLVLVVCFGLAFQYRVIYPFYFYNYYQSYYLYYNPEGQAFCAVLGIDMIYIIISMIMVGVFAKRDMGYEEPEQWQIRPTSTTPGTAEYSRDAPTRVV